MSTATAFTHADARSTIAANVSAELARKRYSIRGAATALGITHVYLSRRLNCSVEFSGTDLVMLAGFLQVPVSRFFLETEHTPDAMDGGVAVDPAGLEPTTSTVVSGRFGRSPAVERPTLAPVTAIRA